MENKINLNHLSGKSVLRANPQKPAVHSNVQPAPSQTTAPKPAVTQTQFSQNLKSAAMGAVKTLPI